MPQRVLFVCTGNSCRSILAEALLNHIGAGRFQAFSAGSHPMGTVNPHALALLREKGLPTAGLRSKSWDAFTQSSLDLVVTVCDDAAGEVCPLFPGSPPKVHWGMPDPARVTGTPAEVRLAFERTYALLESRLRALVALPEGLSTPALLESLKRIAGIAA
ncbi:MAG TPA: arsenate reductase ArsC [bacterium]